MLLQRIALKYMWIKEEKDNEKDFYSSGDEHIEI